MIQKERWSERDKERKEEDKKSVYMRETKRAVGGKSSGEEERETC